MCPANVPAQWVELPPMSDDQVVNHWSEQINSQHVHLPATLSGLPSVCVRILSGGGHRRSPSAHPRRPPSGSCHLTRSVVPCVGECCMYACVCEIVSDHQMSHLWVCILCECHITHNDNNTQPTESHVHSESVCVRTCFSVCTGRWRFKVAVEAMTSTGQAKRSDGRRGNSSYGREVTTHEGVGVSSSTSSSSLCNWGTEFWHSVMLVELQVCLPVLIDKSHDELPEAQTQWSIQT